MRLTQRHVYIGPGLFQDLINKADSMTPEERAELLEGCEQLANVHATGAQEGQTKVLYIIMMAKMAHRLNHFIFLSHLVLKKKSACTLYALLKSIVICTSWMVANHSPLTMASAQI